MKSRTFAKIIETLEVCRYDKLLFLITNIYRHMVAYMCIQLIGDLLCNSDLVRTHRRYAVRVFIIGRLCILAFQKGNIEIFIL